MMPSGQFVIPPGNDARWARWALPLAMYFRTPRTETEVSIFRIDHYLEEYKFVNLLAWLENEAIAHFVSDRWRLTPYGVTWVTTGPTLAFFNESEILVDPDVSGKQYGRWTVVGVMCNERPARWWVRCVCNTERAVLASNLMQRLSKSCGCHRSRHEEAAAAE